MVSKINQRLHVSTTCIFATAIARGKSVTVMFPETENLAMLAIFNKIVLSQVECSLLLVVTVEFGILISIICKKQLCQFSQQLNAPMLNRSRVLHYPTRTQAIVPLYCYTKQFQNSFFPSSILSLGTH